MSSFTYGLLYFDDDEVMSNQAMKLPPRAESPRSVQTIPYLRPQRTQSGYR